MHPPVEYITGDGLEWSGSGTAVAIEDIEQEPSSSSGPVSDSVPVPKSRPSSARGIQLSTPARSITCRPTSTERNIVADKAKLEKDERRRKEKAGGREYSTEASAVVAARTKNDPSTPEE